MIVGISALEFVEEVFILQVNGTFDLAEKKEARKERATVAERNRHIK